MWGNVRQNHDEKWIDTEQSRQIHQKVLKGGTIYQWTILTVGEIITKHKH